jgi:hypothetical protein
MLATLSMAGVPWHFDEKVRAYRVREGFRFPIIENANCDAPDPPAPEPNPDAIREMATQLLEQGEAFAESLDSFLTTLRGFADSQEADGEESGEH